MPTIEFGDEEVLNERDKMFVDKTLQTAVSKYHGKNIRLWSELRRKHGSVCYNIALTFNQSDPVDKYINDLASYLQMGFVRGSGTPTLAFVLSDNRTIVMRVYEYQEQKALYKQAIEHSVEEFFRHGLHDYD